MVVHIFNNYEWWNCGMKINTSYLFTGAVSFYIEPVSLVLSLINLLSIHTRLDYISCRGFGTNGSALLLWKMYWLRMLWMWLHFSRE